MTQKDKTKKGLAEEIKLLQKHIAGFKEADIKRKKVAQIAKEAYKYAESIIETVREPLIVLDAGLKVVSANQSFYQVFKVNPKKTEGVFIYDLGNRQWDIPKLRQLLEGILPKNNFFENYEIEHDFKTIGHRTMLLNARRLEDAQLILLAIEDITERRKAEEALNTNRALKKLNQIKSDFVSTVSHELRTPLSIIKEGLSLVLDRVAGEINEKQSTILATAKNNIDRLARIINDLLDISKIEAGKIELKKELVDIAGLIRQITPFFESGLREKNLELKVNIPEKQIDAFVDPDKITQVFSNLIGNALKFTDKGYIEISLQEKEKEIICFVADTGLGIDEEDLPEVFNKFQQFGRLPGPGEKGTGLGLSIAKGIIEVHGGKIWAESKLGQGTKLSFSLPKYTAEEIFKEYLNNGMREAMDRKTCVTLVAISILEFNKLKQKFSDEKIGAILRGMEGVIRDTLRHKCDIVFKVPGEMMVILVDCDKEVTSSVENRLKKVLDQHLTNEKLSQEIKLRFGSAVYPDEAKNDQELIEKAKKA